MERRAVKVKINDHITLISDKGEATCYVVEGEKYAAVIDTLQGYENLNDIVREITDLPLKVINTHGHGDHAYGNVYFEEALISELDLPLYNKSFSYPEIVEAMKENNLKPCKLGFINDGDLINIGGITLEIISTPGHTPGSLCILDKEDRILFTGDSFNPCIWLQLEESISVTEEKKSAEKVLKRRAEFDSVLSGHVMNIVDGNIVKEIYDATCDILEGRTEKDREYIYFDGKAKAIEHLYHGGENNVVYLKEKL